MTAEAAGRAAYEAYARKVCELDYDRVAYPVWDTKTNVEMFGWDAAAKAGHDAIAAAAQAGLREAITQLADEMFAEAMAIAPASSEPDGMPDMADEIRAELLCAYSGRIRALTGDAEPAPWDPGMHFTESLCPSSLGLIGGGSLPCNLELHHRSPHASLGARVMWNGTGPTAVTVEWTGPSRPRGQS